MTKTPLQFRHNGRDVAIFVDGGTNLLVALRELIGDMTPKFGCGQGGCGACSVLIDGELHLSCLTLAETVAGRSVETLDGIKDGPNLHPLQRAFAENFAAQCGYCTPGMLMAARALLDRNPDPSRVEVVEAISGNICRCTGYEPIINAVLAAAARRTERRACKGDLCLNRAKTLLPTSAMTISRRLASRRSGRTCSAMSQRPRPFSTTTSCRGCCTSRSCAAPTSTPASAGSTFPKRSVIPVCAGSSAAPTSRATSTRCSA